MARGRLSLTSVLLTALLAPLAVAGVDAKAEVKADPPPAGSEEGLAYDQIKKTTIYADNATASALKAPPVDGWWESKICSDSYTYCVYTNRRLGKGRGMVMVTRLEEYQKLESFEHHLEKAENKYFEDPVPFEETELPDKGVVMTATKPIRRGKQFMAWSPVLVVHKDLFDDVPKKKERARLLEAAVNFLPDATRAKFDRQRRRPGDPAGLNPRSIEEILLAHPFEINLGWNYRQEESSRHYVNYPEAALLRHDCRPNVASHIDESFALQATVARRVQPGEELTLAFVDPFLPRAERMEWVKRHRGGKPCSCSACAPPGGEADAAKADKRLQEIVEMRAELRNHDSKKVDFDMIERFVKLAQEDRLQAKLAEVYELAALNFNYLGNDKKAKKYADLAVQAGIVEGGIRSNDAVAMRVMASDIKGHYSYQYTLKRRGQVPK